MSTTLTPAFLTAVIVLYQRTPADSEALTSLDRILAENPPFQSRFQVILYDNSPQPQPTPSTFNGRLAYLHDPSNGGLEAAYNCALQRAKQAASDWLLLLDQDTTLTTCYISELLSACQSCLDLRNISAIVPILELQGRIYSPEADFFYHLRHQFPHPRFYPVTRNTSGIQSGALSAYNSGAAIRVSALQQIGGFPRDFRLDYLDHAVFQQLHQLGLSLYVLNSVLQQKLAHIDLNAVPLSRHTSVLQAQSLFVARYGTWLDRLLYRLWLLRKSRPYRELCKDPRVWKGMVRQAIGPWRLPSSPTPYQERSF
jgi:GT2 family glycosyltransferase